MRANLLILTTLACAASFFFSCADGSIEAAALVACGKFDPEKQICDARDGNLYKIISIGNQKWMAENLRFKNNDAFSCYGDEPENCDGYGMLYRWNNEANKNLCPEGWRIPGDAEWGMLEGLISSDNDLKSRQGWEPYDGNKVGNGDDIYGFNAKPAGVRMFNLADEGSSCDGLRNGDGDLELDDWHGLGSVAAFMYNVAKYSYVILSNGNDPRVPCIGVNSLVSVRCIKD